MYSNAQTDRIIKHVNAEYGEIEIINLKFDKGQALDFAESSEHIYPAYHMNKNNWITIILDDSLADAAIFELVKKSYLLTAK